ncbi:MAG: hypothetical protein ABIO65_01925 [Nitrospiria bacterium]
MMVFAMVITLTAMADAVLASEQDGRGPGLKAAPEAGPLQPRLGGKGTTKPLTAIVIVVEENQAQTYSGKRDAVFDPLEDILDAGFGDMDLDMPKWAKKVVKESGKLVDDVVDAVHKGHVAMVNAVVGEVDQAVGNQSASCFKEMLGALSQMNALGPKPGKVFLDRFGEDFYADCLRQMAEPKYDKVVTLSDTKATFDNFKATLEDLNGQGYLIDVLLDVHGCGNPKTMNNIDCGDPGLGFADGKASRDTIKTINGGKAMNLNAVYMVSCWGGSNFNQVWLDLGAKASNGSTELNYYTLLSPLLFMDGWTRGKSLDEAAEKAYKHEKSFMNGKKHKIKMKFRNPVTGQKETVKIGIGATWRKLMDQSLAKNYGENKKKRVNNRESSKRMTAGDGSVRRAGR